MAKRSADTERIGDENEFGSSAPSTEPQNQRATAAQLAARNFPAPAWGAHNSTSAAGIQQQPPSNGFTFGQPFSQSTNTTAENNNQTSSQSSSFPPFGGFSTSFGQQTNAPAPSGFNFSAPTVNNPFANLNQNSNSQATPNGTSGNVFSTPSKPATTEEEQAKLPASDRKTPPNWMTNLPPADRETDPQAFFIPHAPFKWGQPDTPAQEQPSQAASVSHPANVGQQDAQTPINVSGQNEQPKQTTSNLFAHLQQPSSSTPNPFSQQAAQQPQTSNVFGQQTTSLFQPQFNQPVSNPFAHLNTTQNQSSSNLFNKPPTSPTKDDDSMSTTPDTSPQSNNERDRYGPFASATAAPKRPLMNGSTQGGSGSSLFSFPQTSSNNQSVTSTPFGEPSTDANGDQGSQDGENGPSGISLGSPKKNQGAASIKNRKIAQPTMGRSDIEENTPAKNPFAFTPVKPFASTPSASASETPSLFQTQPNANSGITENSSSPLFGKANTQISEARASSTSRQPGTPPTPPEDFNEEQKRQLITGWRLKSLDRGLQSYLEYSSYTEEEIESISTFYHLRKQAILDADGGPVEDMNKKRRDRDGQGQHSLQTKKARRQSPSATSNQNEQATGEASIGRSNRSKRKAVEELSKGNGRIIPNSAKRSKPENPVTYPSLPSYSSSQTAKMFGNLVGKKSDERSSAPGESEMNEKPSNRVAPTGVASSQAGSLNSTSRSNNKQPPLFKFPTGSASTFAQSSPGNQNSSSLFPSTETSTPFKRGFPSQSDSGISGPPASNQSSTGPLTFTTAQPSNSSSVFSNLNRNNSNQSKPKRKANDFDADEGSGDEAGLEDLEEQRSKKQRTEEVSKSTTDSDKENDHRSKRQSTTERLGIESIFSQPGVRPADTSNMFSHLGNIANQHEDDDADDDEADDDDQLPRKARKGSKQRSSSPMTNGSSNLSKSNPFGSSVYNPFAGSSFNTPKEPADEGKSAGRSPFDCISRDDKSPPLPSFENVDFGQSILKTRKTGGVSDQINRATGSNLFGAASPAGGSITPGNTGASSTSETPAATPASNPFSKTLGSNTAPFANMTGQKNTEDSPGSDHTWKVGTPVKFSGISGAPSINFTSPSPSKTPLSGLFGAPKAGTTSETPGSSIFKPFDPSSPKPAPLTFGISAPPKASNDSLAPPSETQSESTSRATSPGAGESGNEASDLVHEEESHPELDTTEASKAEADEDTIFDVTARVHKLTDSKNFDATTGKEEMTKKWVMQGREQFRVLKHRDTKKTRMLMKLKVNGRVILNAGLQKSLAYVLAEPKKVRIPVPTGTKVESWLVQVGKEADAEKLVSLLEENKAS
ncbi:MAG: hypothetical protein Q9166_004585 [cf. Caloplaca sp. 2 TL-2023]